MLDPEVKVFARNAGGVLNALKVRVVQRDPMRDGFSVMVELPPAVPVNPRGDRNEAYQDGFDRGYATALKSAKEALDLLQEAKVDE